MTVVLPSAGEGEVTTMTSTFPSRSWGSRFARRIRKEEAVAMSVNASAGPLRMAREGGMRPTTG